MLKDIAVLLTVGAFAFPATAAPKKLSCNKAFTNGNGEKVETSFVSILDTDDFNKESPQHEVTLTKFLIAGVPFSQHPTLGGYDVVGKTYRMNYEVTPTTISLVVRTSSLVGQYTDGTDTFDVSRKDLTIERGSCTIEDYKVENAL